MISLVRNQRRRVAVSLTALVDLLFMVMFMQYLQLQQGQAELASQTSEAVRRQEEAESAKAQADARREDALVLKEDALGQVAALTARLDDERAESERLSIEVDKLRVENQDLKVKYEGAVAEVARTQEEAAQIQNQLGEMVKGMFTAVDSDALAAVLEHGASSEEIARITSELKAAQSQTAAQAVQSLRRSREVQKRVDIWEVHLFRNGTVRVRSPGTGGAAVERVIAANNEDEFTSQFMPILNEVPDAKNLVIVLYTHENAKGGHVRGVQAALGQVETQWEGKLGEKRVSISAPQYSESAP